MTSSPGVESHSACSISGTGGQGSWMVAVATLQVCPHRGTNLDAALVLSDVSASLCRPGMMFSLSREGSGAERGPGTGCWAWNPVRPTTVLGAGRLQGAWGPVSLRRHLAPPGAGLVSGDQCLRFRACEPGSDEPRV